MIKQACMKNGELRMFNHPYTTDIEPVPFLVVKVHHDDFVEILHKNKIQTRHKDFLLKATRKICES